MLTHDTDWEEIRELVTESEDERPEDERGRDELVAAFAALGGPLTEDEFIRLLGSDEYYGVVVRLAALLLDGDTAAVGAVSRDSLTAVLYAWGRLGDPEKAHVNANGWQPLGLWGASRSGAVVGEADPVGDGCCLGAAGGVELGQDVRYMDAGGLRRDEELGGDVTITVALADQA
jgi:hypothetical protein